MQGGLTIVITSKTDEVHARAHELNAAGVSCIASTQNRQLLVFLSRLLADTSRLLRTLVVWSAGDSLRPWTRLNRYSQHFSNIITSRKPRSIMYLTTQLAADVAEGICRLYGLSHAAVSCVPHYPKKNIVLDACTIRRNHDKYLAIRNLIQ